MQPTQKPIKTYLLWPKILKGQSATDWYEKHLTSKNFLDNHKFSKPSQGEILLEDNYWDED